MRTLGGKDWAMIKSMLAGAALVAVVAGAAQAADMPLKARPAPVPVYSWTGFYGGINGGYGWSSDRTITFTPGDPNIVAQCGTGLPGTCAPPASSKLQGGFGGLQAGFNWQVNPFFLAGIEADFQGSAIRGSTTSPSFSMAGLAMVQIVPEQSVTWFGTVRGRLGFLPTDRLLIYATGGFAFGRVEANSVLTADGLTGAGGFGLDFFAPLPPALCRTASRDIRPARPAAGPPAAASNLHWRRTSR